MDRPLLGMQWDGHFFMDTALPFGLRSAPKIFMAVADAVEWVAREQGVPCIQHYLDDFIIMGHLGSLECQQSLDSMLRVFDHLGIPVATEKLEGSTTRLTFLGMEIDLAAMEVRLPSAKLRALQETVAAWLGWQSCSRRELDSLLGSLGHAC